MHEYNHHNQHHTPQIPLEDIPVMKYLKRPVATLNELMSRYPEGGQHGWFALVYAEKTFAFWNDNPGQIAHWQLLTTNNPNTTGDNIFTELPPDYNFNTLQLEDGIYTVGHGLYIITNYKNENGEIDGQLQTKLSSSGMMWRKIEISTPQIYPEWSASASASATQNIFIQYTDPSLYHEMIEGVSHWISTVTWIDYTWTSDTWVEL